MSDLSDETAWASATDSRKIEMLREAILKLMSGPQSLTSKPPSNSPNIVREVEDMHQLLDNNAPHGDPAY
jgi:hypothetical protein